MTVKEALEQADFFRAAGAGSGMKSRVLLYTQVWQGSACVL